MAADDSHRATDLPGEEGVAYLSVIASLAAANGDVPDPDIAQLHKVASSFSLSAHGLGPVVSDVDEPDVHKSRASIDRLRGAQLRFTLLTEFVLAVPGLAPLASRLVWALRLSVLPTRVVKPT